MYCQLTVKPARAPTKNTVLATFEMEILIDHSLNLLKMEKRYYLLAFGLMTFFACRKIPDTGQLSNSFVVQTSQDKSANFANYKTYYISDTIARHGTADSIWFDNNSQQLVDAVKTNMAARGYTFVSSPHSSPDLGLGLTAIKDLNIGVIYPGWWWGYWGGCYWGYCGYPPYYPWYGGGIVYSIPTGTFILDMIDLKNASADTKLTEIWGSVMSGGLGNTADDIALGVEAIDQAFTQSPYVQTH
jgi:hypothetical protein